MENAMKLLIDEKHDYFSNPLKIITESNSEDGHRDIRFQGIFMEFDIRNKNGRKYPLEEGKVAVQNYQPKIADRRALGELEHPESASINTERACFECEKLYIEGNNAIGQGRVLQYTPMGKIVAGYLMDGIKLGTSSRGLGDLVESTYDGPTVKNFEYVCNDIIHDPSAPRAYINGILEKKEYILQDGVICERHVDNFERNLRTIPKHDTNEYLFEQLQKFLNDITKGI